MAYTTINKSSSFMNTKLWTGDGSTQTISGVGFQPDWTWVKGRNAGGESHRLTDIIRGVGYNLKTNGNEAQFSVSNGIQSWNSDGFIIGPDDAFNKNTKNFVSWNWKAGTGQGSSNTDGSINTIYTSVNTTAGFSISSYTGTGSAATVGHGLGAVPKMMIIKSISDATDWNVYHNATTANTKIILNTTAAAVSGTNNFGGTTPTSSVFTVNPGGGQTNDGGETYIAYCFAEKTGYSKFGSYVGNGSADGAFIYTGFKPAFILIKKTSGAASWYLNDNRRSSSGGFNVSNEYLRANLSNETGTDQNGGDFLSNGFKLRNADTDYNASGQTYIYMAFGQTLVGTNNIPANAR